MKYRIRLDLIFDEKEDAMKAFNFLKEKRVLFRTIRKGEPNEERSILEIHKCYHDEDPTKPCGIIEYIESE